MANTIRIKRTTSSSRPTSLANAELAFIEGSQILVYGTGTGGASGSATSIIDIGGTGAFLGLGSGLTQTAAGTYTFNNSVTFSGTTSLGSASATTQTSSDNSTKVATTAFVKAQGYLTTATNYRLDQFAAPTSDVAFNSQKITGLADPTNAQDAATKAYVDAARSGLDVKDSVRVATTASITLSGTQTIDGVALSAGDRVLVKNQSTGSQNGIYVVAAGSWARATDADSSAEVTSGLFTFVEEGTTNADSGWVLSTNSTITLGTTSLAFAQFSGAGQLTAGDGLTKTGNTIDVVTASSTRIVVSANSIDLATTGVSASTYKSVTVDTYGRVTAGTNPTTLSGYGITDALSASSDIDGGSYP
jgi:hypothetical protein